MRAYWSTLFQVFLAGMLAVGSAQAHHSARAVFTDEDIEIDGVVMEFSFKNPHVNIMLNVTDESGTETLWMASGPAPTIWRRGGWTPETLQEGQYVQLGGKKSRTGAPMLLMSFDAVEAGGIAVLDPINGSVVRTIRETPNDNQQPDPSTRVPLTLSNGQPNLSGIWVNGLPRGTRTGGQISRPALTEAAVSLQAGYDALDDPAFARCTDAILARQLISPLGVKLTQHEDRVVFEYEHGGVRRVVYLGERDSETVEHTLLGRSVARYEDDVLVIESSQLLGGLMVMGPQSFDLSDRTTVRETYRRADQAEYGALLNMRMTIDDPVYLTAPLELGWLKNFVAQYDFDEVDCKLPLPPGD